MSLKLDQARQEFAEFNRRFKSGLILDERLYIALEVEGIDFHKSTLVDLFPDSGDTYVGTIILESGKIMKFDISLGNPSENKWNDISIEYQHKYKVSKKHHPFERHVVAYEYFIQNRVGKENR
jgi:hypothetical protein